MPNQWRKSPYVVRLNSRRLSTGPSKAKRQAYYDGLTKPLSDAIILALFSNNEQGAYYDPYDLTDEKLAWVANFGSDLTDKFSYDITGGSPSGSYNGATGHFTIQRINGFNEQSFIRIQSPSISIGKQYKIKVEIVSTTGSLHIRTNGFQSVTYSLNMGMNELTITPSIEPNFTICMLSDNSTATGVIHSIREIPSSADFMEAFPNHTLFQDSLGTIPVTGHMQPIGRVLDKSGNGNHAHQPNSAFRPLWQNNGGLKSFWFDGADDHLLSTLVAGNSNAMTYWVNYRAESQTGYLIHEGSNDTVRSTMSYAVLVNLSGMDSLVFSGAVTVFPSQINLSTLAEMQGDKSALTGFFRAPTNSVNYTIPSEINANTQMVIGCRVTNGTPAVFFRGHIYSLIIRSTLTPEAQALPIRQLLATRSGVTL